MMTSVPLELYEQAINAANAALTGVPPGSKVLAWAVYGPQGEVIGSITPQGYYIAGMTPPDEYLEKQVRVRQEERRLEQEARERFLEEQQKILERWRREEEERRKRNEEKIAEERRKRNEEKIADLFAEQRKNREYYERTTPPAPTLRWADPKEQRRADEYERQARETAAPQQQQEPEAIRQMTPRERRSAKHKRLLKLHGFERTAHYQEVDDKDPAAKRILMGLGKVYRPRPDRPVRWEEYEPCELALPREILSQLGLDRAGELPDFEGELGRARGNQGWRTR